MCKILKKLNDIIKHKQIQNKICQDGRLKNEEIIHYKTRLNKDDIIQKYDSTNQLILILVKSYLRTQREIAKRTMHPFQCFLWREVAWNLQQPGEGIGSGKYTKL